MPASEWCLRVHVSDAVVLQLSCSFFLLPCIKWRMRSSHALKSISQYKREKMKERMGSQLLQRKWRLAWELNSISFSQWIHMASRSKVRLQWPKFEIWDDHGEVQYSVANTSKGCKPHRIVRRRISSEKRIQYYLAITKGLPGLQCNTHILAKIFFTCLQKKQAERPSGWPARKI
jgi:hypothetical protein